MSENERLIHHVLGERPSSKAVLDVCRNFRMAGICSLFLHGTPEDFHWRLHQGARCYAHFLPRFDEGSTLTSRALPFFDAVAVQDLEAAHGIARHSRRTWGEGLEYEEDFLFVEFLMRHFFLETPDAECHRLLERYEEALRGAEDFRLGVCKALLESDTESFGAALTDFLRERRDRLAGVASRGHMEEELLATEGQLSVEGLALVRLAEQKGIATEVDYLHVPSIAREPPSRTFQPKSWRQVHP
ncbi:immunity 49 family protein [Pyxidicoccus fallax]|uniref:Immunity 49 family protein n=1 Tax=Pyxidicoccus fallax TaxID=394095 RepID=A0A848L8W5_9BACT|nr:Imm49 family immunity protein [Pyxidicoccus fallax]NMO14692.1 immunity 49 family protein [Pyxidicoccus fallax]NPC80500.1 immunity 49 family protein [Pyxidicoccus fallax]